MAEAVEEVALVEASHEAVGDMAVGMPEGMAEVTAVTKGIGMAVWFKLLMDPISK